MSVTEDDSSLAAPETRPPEEDTKSQGDERGGLSLTMTPPSLGDPAILSVTADDKMEPTTTTARRFRYDRDELVRLREAPLSQRRPDSLLLDGAKEAAVNILYNWGENRWSAEGKKKSESETQIKRPVDPKERIRKENEGGIVLSPQRRSFNSGCFVPVRGDPRSNRPKSPLAVVMGIKAGGDVGGGGGGGGGPVTTTTTAAVNRRIGSGRILRGDSAWDFDSKGDDFRSSQPPSQQQRRSFGRDFDSGGGDMKRSDRRYDSRNNRRECDEPEWFSSGPISQNDTIELRGFEESDHRNNAAASAASNTSANGKKKMSASQAKRARDWFNNKRKDSETIEEREDDLDDGDGGGGGGIVAKNSNKGDSAVKKKEKKVNGQHQPIGRSSTPTSQYGGAGAESERNGGKGEKGDSSSNNKSINESFIFDDIFKSDSIPGLPGILTNGVEDQEGDAPPTATKSRFSKWFSDTAATPKDPPTKETKTTLVGDSNSYFAPISPAANTGGGGDSAHSTGKSINVMDILMMQQQKGGSQQQQQQKSRDVATGRILNLVELEAKMRQNQGGTTGGRGGQGKSEEDMTAFNRLLATLSENNNNNNNNNGGVAKVASPQQPPMSLMEMLSHSQQQDEAQARMTQQLLQQKQQHFNHHYQQQQQQQQQQDILAKLMNVGIQMTSPVPPDMAVQQSGRELLNRPEAQAILQGLKVGDITPQHLYQQLANPALQPRHRDMLVAILKQVQGGHHSPIGRVVSPLIFPRQHQQQQQTSQQSQQQLRVSPLPPNALHQRIPSPRELQVHTQNILQRALIKKKLEEQQENYRKKQEMQHTLPAQQPKSVSSPTPLAFTPTSVLRKMTADKDDITTSSGSGHNHKGQGRPLTGGMRGVAGLQSQQQQQQQWQFPIASNTATAPKQTGRPIVKANNLQQQQQQVYQQYFAAQQQLQQQQQQRKVQQQMFQQHQSSVYNHQQQQQQLSQLRAQHQQHARPVVGATPPSGGAGEVAGAPSGGGSTSANQLTRWFSPDLLERARVGELPSTANLANRVLSLEDVERLAPPPAVHSTIN